MHGWRAGAANLLVARQPIFDRAPAVVAYELLARRTLTDATWNGEPDDSRTTARVIGQAFLDMDVWSLTEGLPAFINFTRDLLLDGTAERLPTDLTVVEIVETVTADPRVEAACRRLHDAGYRIALDDVVAADPRLPLLPVVDVVKIDFAATSVEDRVRLLDQCRAAGVQVLAEKVETPAQRAEAHQMGCDLFQGYFFQKPAIVGARQHTGTWLAHLQLLRSVTSETIDRDAIGNVLARDARAAEAFLDLVATTDDVGRRPATARDALDQLDDPRLVRLIAVLVVRWLGRHHPRALLDAALFRAHFCQRLTELRGPAAGADPVDAFLAGLCSLLDALVGEPLADVLARIQLPATLTDACLRGEGPLGVVLSLVRAYEQGRWDDLRRHATTLDVDTDVLGPLFFECLGWTRRVEPAQPA